MTDLEFLWALMMKSRKLTRCTLSMVLSQSKWDVKRRNGGGIVLYLVLVGV